MKNWIKKQLRESLNEVKPIPKSKIGMGGEHVVFSSEKHPNRLYKIGRKDSVMRWLNIFKDNPRIFPKVYRVFQSIKNPNYWIVEIEKLDVKSARVDYENASELFTYFTLDKFNKRVYIYRIDNLDNMGIKFNDLIIEFRNYLEQNIKDKSKIILYLKWVKTVYQVYKYLEKKYKYYDKDIHDENVAYDNNGNIKIIDI